MKKTIAILRALVEVMESLSKDADPHGVGRQITEEVHVLLHLDWANKWFPIESLFVSSRFIVPYCKFFRLYVLISLII